MNRTPFRSNFQPTETVPGSEERIRVMQARKAAGQPLFHPGDKKDDLAAAIEGVVARNGVIQKTTRAVDIREKSEECNLLHQPRKLSSILTIHRKRAGLSIAALSERSGISRRTILNIEHGDHEPTVATVSAILKALGQVLHIGDQSVA